MTLLLAPQILQSGPAWYVTFSFCRLYCCLSMVFVFHCFSKVTFLLHPAPGSTPHVYSAAIHSRRRSLLSCSSIESSLRGGRSCMGVSIEVSRKSAICGTLSGAQPAPIPLFSFLTEPRSALSRCACSQGLPGNNPAPAPGRA